MLTEIRWQKEQELMHSVFPQFEPFVEGQRFGFRGYLRGRRSGKLYRVVLEAEQQSYPQQRPDISIRPRIGHHWIGMRLQSLCMSAPWRAARSTFANTLLAAVKYLGEYDGEPGPRV